MGAEVSLSPSLMLPCYTAFSVRAGRCRRCGEDHPDSVCRDLQSFLRKLVVPRYRQGVPSVEVSFQLLNLSDLDARNRCFSSEFVLVLDWIDPNLHRDTHYTEDYQAQRLKLFPAIAPHIFNPGVCIDNATEDFELLPDSESSPQIVSEVRGGLRMRRRLHYRGRLSCVQESYRTYPFDEHAFSVCIKSQCWGAHKAAKFCHPTGAAATSRPRYSLGGHDVREDVVHLGDLHLFAFGVRQLRSVSSSFGASRSFTGLAGDGQGTTYEVILCTRRDVTRYLFTFFILCVMVLAGALSFFCTMSVDVLTGRLSINVTVLLSMVAFTTQRPAAIECLPYNTVYDSYVQFCTCMTALTSFANLATFLRCFEVIDGCDECIRMEEPMCHRYGWCGALVIDCRFVEAILGIMLMYNVRVFGTTYRNRQRELMHYRTVCGDASWSLFHNLPVAQHSPGEPIFFVSGRNGGLQRPMDSIFNQASAAAAPEGAAGESSPSSPQRQKRRRRQTAPTAHIEQETHFLDLGTGEMGYYVYSVDDGLDGRPQGEVRCKYIAPKEPVPAIVTEAEEDEEESFSGTLSMRVAEAWEMRLSALRCRLLEYLRKHVSEVKNLPAGSACAPPTRILVGISGSLAIAAERSELVADRLEEFIGMLEQEWAAQGETHVSFNYFVLSRETAALFERIAICWLMQEANMGLTADFARTPELREYIRQQLSSWALLGGRRYGELDQAEFIEKMLPLSAEPTLERRVMTTLEWFRLMDVDRSKTVTIGEMLNFFLNSEELLQAVICKRLFVGTIAGTTAAMQLTVADPAYEGEGQVSLHSCDMGNGTPLLHGLFPPNKPVDREGLQRWREWLNLGLNGKSLDGAQSTVEVGGGVVPGSPSSGRAVGQSPRPGGSVATEHRSALRDSTTAALAYGLAALGSMGTHVDSRSTETRTTRTAWPSGLRGVFVGISSMYYAAEACGIDERLVRKRAALDALSATLKQELESFRAGMPGPSSQAQVRSHQRKVANLSMAHAMITHVLHEDAWLYFRRNWNTSDDRNFVATWSLGCFLCGKRCSALNELTQALARAAGHTSDMGGMESEEDDPFAGETGAKTFRRSGAWRRTLGTFMGSAKAHGSSSSQFDT